MIKLPNFNDEERKKFNEGVFLLSGKAKNRTALGIIACIPASLSTYYIC